MNTYLLVNTNINNIATIYGGIRGTTLSSRHNMRHWPTVIESGIRTIIELRKDDHSDRLCQMCEKYGIGYLEFPIDSNNVPNEVIAQNNKSSFLQLMRDLFILLALWDCIVRI